MSQDCQELFIDYERFGKETISEANLWASAGSSADACTIAVDEDMGILSLETGQGRSLDLAEYPYYTIPRCLGLMQNEGNRNTSFDTLSLEAAGISQVQKPPLSLTGKGVILGFIDTGIRYTLDVFRDAGGGSRILSLWDQTIQEGVPPEGFFFGTEYGRDMIDSALSSQRPRDVVPSWDEDGHGTALASVAAGSSLENGSRFLGAAPDADIVVVKLREAKRYLRDYYLLPENARAYSECDIVLAVKYLENVAASAGKPVVICIGLGNSLGSHTGTSMMSRYLNRVSERRNRAVVVSGGNEGASSHHFQGAVIQNGGVEEAELRIGEGSGSFMLEFWGEGPNRFNISIQAPGGETVTGIGGKERKREEYRFIFDKTYIYVNYVPLEEKSGGSLLLFRFFNPTAGIWTFRIETVSVGFEGKYDMWLPVSEFLRGDIYFLRPEPYITLTSPANAEEVITISAYNDQNGGFYEKSGRGFTADRRMKPDQAVPGVEVPTILGRRTGSSICAAMAAGAVAQLLQWAVVEGYAPLISGRSIRYYLSLGAERSTGIRYPSREWGLGKLNVEQIFLRLAGL